MLLPAEARRCAFGAPPGTTTLPICLCRVQYWPRTLAVLAYACAVLTSAMRGTGLGNGAVWA
eukprot:3941277-Rhodomonas_salina.2